MALTQRGIWTNEKKRASRGGTGEVLEARSTWLYEQGGAVAR